MDSQRSKEEIDEMDERGRMFDCFHSRTLYNVSQAGRQASRLAGRQEAGRAGGQAKAKKAVRIAPDGLYGLGDLTAVFTSI
jgi:hypothetical protein